MKTRASINGKAKPDADPTTAWQAQVRDKEIEEVWDLVDRCHFETQKKPKDEECKFCGNMCNSWKKLTVHLAKHMELIAMPVLDLVKRRDISPDTIISPGERISRQPPILASASPEQYLKAEPISLEPNSLSPYEKTMSPQQAGFQVSQSPGAHSHDSHYTQSIQSSPKFSDTTASAYEAQVTFQAQDMPQFSRMHNVPAPMCHGSYQDTRRPLSFVPINSPGGQSSTYPPPFNAGSLSPQPMAPNGSRTYPRFLQVHSTLDGQPSQQPVYSSPTDNGPYAPHVDGSLGSMHIYATKTMAYEQNGMLAGMTMPPSLPYDSPQKPPFLSDPSNDQSYPYTAQ